MSGLEIVSLIFLVVLLVAAVFIVVAVVFQKTGEDGLSGAIAGGADTFYGRDKSAHTDRILFKWTMIAGIVFVVATLVVYIIQPDYSNSFDLDAWKDMNSFSFIFD